MFENGFEPMTSEFSAQRSTTELLKHINYCDCYYIKNNKKPQNPKTPKPHYILLKENMKINSNH